MVATENGELMVCETSGEYMAYIADSPHGLKVICIVPYSRGFLLGTEDGKIYTYERIEDPSNPYKRVKEKSETQKEKQGE